MPVFRASSTDFLSIQGENATDTRRVSHQITCVKFDFGPHANTTQLLAIQRTYTHISILVLIWLHRCPQSVILSVSES